MTILTASNSHAYQPGTLIHYSSPETRWLVRIWKFIRYEDHNLRWKTAKIVEVPSATTMTTKE